MTKEEYTEHTKNWEKQPVDLITSSFLPNGVYRILFHVYNDMDTIGMNVNYQYEHYYRMNDEIF